MISRFALGISTCSFLFQLTVLNPWHIKISKQLEQIDKKIK